MLKDSFFFSIITVAYNSQNTIRDTILSILNQEFNNIEYIIIDGGSSDLTVDIAEGFRVDFEKVGIKYVIVSERDKGIYDAMNKGIKLANGDWIGIINSDDYYSLQCLKHVYEAISGMPNSELVYGNMTVLDDNGVEVLYRPRKPVKDIVNCLTIFHPTVFVSRQVYQRYGKFNSEFKLVGDWEFLKRIYLRGVRFHYVNNVLATFRKGGAGSGFKMTHLSESMRVRHSYLRWDFIWYDLKDWLVYLYYLFFPNRSLF